MHQELFDPIHPQYQRPRRGQSSVYSYMVSAVGDVISDRNGLWQQKFSLTHDESSGGGEYPPLIMRHKSRQELDVIRSKIELVAALEATSLKQYHTQDLEKADFNRGEAMKIRERLERDHKVTALPRREWLFEQGQIMPQMKRMF